MAEKTIWMVRAGKGGMYVDDFIDSRFVGIGFGDAGEVASPVDKDELIARMQAANPNKSHMMAASQLQRFFDEFQIGDTVLTYDPGQRLYFVGEITSDIKIRNEFDLFRTRDVTWTGKVVRDSLKQSTKNSLGAISTLFRIKGDTARDVLLHIIELDAETSIASQPVVGDSEDEDYILDVEGQANELLEDIVAKLDWEQMQDLVAEILRAMGFKADVSPRGSDRGIDVFASPDGLGLTEPRVFVEVKHRLGTRMGADHVRTFLGGRQVGDRCLYVSTGGFSKEARYEAERSNIPIKLIDLPKLRELVVEHYESFSPEGISLLPLKKVFWPAT